MQYSPEIAQFCTVCASVTCVSSRRSSSSARRRPENRTRGEYHHTPSSFPAPPPLPHAPHLPLTITPSGTKSKWNICKCCLLLGGPRPSLGDKLPWLLKHIGVLRHVVHADTHRGLQKGSIVMCLAVCVSMCVWGEGGEAVYLCRNAESAQDNVFGWFTA